MFAGLWEVILALVDVSKPTFIIQTEETTLNAFQDIRYFFLGGKKLLSDQPLLEKRPVKIVGKKADAQADKGK
jgi:hypothetical protein